MMRGIYNTVAAMVARARQHDVTAINVANAGTPGYKRQSIFIRRLAEAQRLDAPALMCKNGQQFETLLKAALLALALLWPAVAQSGYCVQALRAQAAADLGLDVQDVVVTLGSAPLLSGSSKEYTYRFASMPRGRVTVIATGADGKSTSFTANVRIWGITLVAKRAIARGEHLADSQFTIVRRDITDFTPVPRGELADQRARLAIPAGGALTSNRVEPIPIIHGGSDVTVVLTRGRIKVTRKGTALSDARIGDRLRVRIDGRTTIQSTVTGPNLCSVGK